MLNSVAPPPAHSSWGSINVIGDGGSHPSHAASPVIHFPHAPPTELYTFEEEPALYEAQEAFTPSAIGDSLTVDQIIVLMGG